MSHREMPDELLAEVSEEKRNFLKRLIAGTAFAVPVILSFSMDSLKLKAAYGASPSGPVSPVFRPKP